MTGVNAFRLKAKIFTNEAMTTHSSAFGTSILRIAKRGLVNELSA